MIPGDAVVAKFAVILPAAGRSSRFRGQALQEAVRAAGRPGRLAAFGRAVPRRNDVVQVILVISPEDREDFNFKFASNMAILGIEVIRRRRGAGRFGRGRLGPGEAEADFVCVHDAARPCLTDAWIDEIFAAAEKTGAAIFAIPVTGTLKRVGGDRKIEETVARDGLWEAQTPQVFRRQLLLDAYARRGAAFRPPTTPNWSSGSAIR